MDSFIYAQVLTPALTELLPRSGMSATPANVGVVGSILFALFLVGWGLSFIWGPIADQFGRTNVLAATIFTFAIFTGLSALAQNVWELATFRFIAGVGISGEWALAGTYVAEAWPEDRRKMGAGYLQTGYYAGFFLAAALNYTIGVHFGWRAMFLTGAVPIVVAILFLTLVKETDKWQHAAMGKGDATRTASWATGLLSIGTILGCIALPAIAERIGRRKTAAIYFAGMAVAITGSFGWAFYLPDGLAPFIAWLFVLGFFGGNFALFSLWLPEQFETRVRATAFAFCTSFGRFVGAGVNFMLGAAVLHTHTLGYPLP